MGSAAVLLGRPHWPFESRRTETVNDANCFVSNFWRALQADPMTVAKHCNWPVNEADLHARHLWLVNVGKKHVEQLRTDPDYFDAKIAGWWVWGLCQWIGSGWCHHPEWKKLPHLGDDGRGIHRPSQQLPHLGTDGMGEDTSGLIEYLHALADRFRGVRVCCGDWSRVCGPTPTIKLGLTGVFLDPPYADAANRKADLYAIDSLNVAHDVRKWCIENGDNPELRIALCGYEGEHEMPDSWDCVAWKANGGYGSQGTSGKTNGRENSTKERIWFSPHCIGRKKQQRELFGDEDKV